MKILLSGASGFLGSRLIPHLRAAGHETVQLVRRAPANAGQQRWNPAAGVLDPAVLGAVDAVVNLTGANVGAHRWTSAFKKLLIESRVDATTTLARAIAKAPGGPKIFVSASGVNYYGDTGDRPVDEQSPPGEGFLADLCRVWEDATRPAEDAGCRVTHVRSGIPLATDGGLLKPLYLQFKLFAGGRMGSGKQYLPWISVPDWLAAIDFLLTRDDLAGPVNLTGPEPVTNAEFSATLGRIMHRPHLLPVPSLALRAVAGEFAREAVASLRVLPRVLAEHGFAFEHKTVDDALEWAIPLRSRSRKYAPGNRTNPGAYFLDRLRRGLEMLGCHA
jgi:uncharacterized protein